MKKTIYAAVAVLAGLLISLTPFKVQAGGGGPTIEFTKSSGSAVADNSSKITFSVYAYNNICITGDATGPDTCSDGSTPQKQGSKNVQLSVAVSGTGNSVGGTYTGGNGAPSFKTGDDGKASFTLASSVAESKILTIYSTELNDPNHSKNPKLEVSFTAPIPAKKKTTTPTPAPVEVKPPDAPATSTIEANGAKVAATDTITIKSNEDLTLSGTTVPNGVVKLFIFSTPREVTVTADASGNWTYVISGLEAGSHHVEAEVTDPATGKTSTRATLAAFTVEEPVVTMMAVAQPKPKDNNLVWILAGAVVLVLLAGGFVCWWLWKRKKQADMEQGKDQTPPKPDDTNPEPPHDNEPKA